MAEQLVEATDDDSPVRLRFTGKQITRGELDVWLLDDGVLLLMERGYETFDDAEDFGDWVHDEETLTTSAATPKTRCAAPLPSWGSSP